MRVLVDTNVLLDAFMKREPFFEDSDRVVKLCSNKKFYGFLAAHTITNLFYILRKKNSNEKCREIIMDLLTVFKVDSINIEKISKALLDEDFKDFEDCLQVECAKAVDADYIITRDTKDFEKSTVPCVTPAEFCNLFD